MSWSSNLQSLEKQGAITGFGLITAQGPTPPTKGCFVEECAEGVSRTVQALIQPFFSATEPPTTHTLNGTKLQIIQQTDSYYVAISKQRQLGLIALNLPVGVLLVTFDRSTHPTKALAAIQGACSAAPASGQCAHSCAATLSSSAVVSAPS